MKKTAISIALLVAVGLPVVHYGQTTRTGTSLKSGNQIPIAKVFDKLSKSTNTSFFYSSSDFRGIYADESAINYSSLEQALSYLKTHYPVEYEIRNNTVVLRKTATKSISKKKYYPHLKQTRYRLKKRKSMKWCLLVMVLRRKRCIRVYCLSWHKRSYRNGLK